MNGAAIAGFNAALTYDPRVEQVLIPLRDGLTLIRRVAVTALLDLGRHPDGDVAEPGRQRRRDRWPRWRRCC